MDQFAEHGISVERVLGLTAETLLTEENEGVFASLKCLASGAIPEAFLEHVAIASGLGPEDFHNLVEDLLAFEFCQTTTQQGIFRLHARLHETLPLTSVPQAKVWSLYNGWLTSMRSL